MPTRGLYNIQIIFDIFYNLYAEIFPYDKTEISEIFQKRFIEKNMVQRQENFVLPSFKRKSIYLILIRLEDCNRKEIG